MVGLDVGLLEALLDWWDEIEGWEVPEEDAVGLVVAVVDGEAVTEVE